LYTLSGAFEYGLRMRTILAPLALAAGLLALVSDARAVRNPDDPDSGAALIGRPAPAWTFTRWVRGEPQSLQRLRGRVVLLRWFTEGCRFCEATLPGLEQLRERYAGRGRVVIGVFHPKPPRDLSDSHIRTVATRLGFAGPLAFDRDW